MKYWMVGADGVANKYGVHFGLEEEAVVKEEKKDVCHEINNSPEYFTCQQ